MHKSRLGTLIIDCQTDNLSAEAEFWSAAFGAPAEHSDSLINPRYIRLDSEPSDPMIILQQVEHPSRIHIDIETDDIAAEVKRLQALGASVIEVMERWTVMQAPSGHRFCVINPVRRDFDTQAKSWAD